MKLLPDAQRGALAFSLCRTQWAYAPNGAPTGLRYDGVTSVLRLRGAEFGVTRSDISQVFADLQAMEAAFVHGVRERMNAEAAARDKPMTTTTGGARHGRA